jgi:hypothetical protein
MRLELLTRDGKQVLSGVSQVVLTDDYGHPLAIAVMIGPTQAVVEKAGDPSGTFDELIGMFGYSPTPMKSVSGDLVLE